MSLGTLALSIRQKYGNGFWAAYYRDNVRPNILETHPIQGTINDICEIHVLTSAQDWLNLMWALKSFYWASKRRYALCIHDDGSLTSKHCDLLKYHFPDARIINRITADTCVFEKLVNHLRCLDLRKSNVLSLKVFDFACYLNAERMLLLDSDILFFQEPTTLLQRIEAPKYRLNTVNSDINSAYTIDPTIVKEKCNFEMIERFNSGLGLIHKASLNFDWIEEFLTLPDIIGHFWRIEQTLYALLSSKYGVELLPNEYMVSLEKNLKGLPSRHYVGAIRHLMYSEGIRQLVKQGFLKELVQ